MSGSQKRKLRKMFRIFGRFLATAFAFFGLYAGALLAWWLA